ncbi:acetyltransferase [Paenibacillus cucumis (ex Kampfer et al. 2016)]|uniref:Acetyltransferase n=1 Tax=Paenibacillus cucumis (ex Kampfer et al. 2016) TaxID=1776858 RepID=A0ABS7KPI2_9BACL|nr:acetyltransferase [Paenibacillus cucumis (ex Kampfer et al. 2016)]MBY0206040.1 acetyltransferase [Paenibacillus cucumis (ex Kampfer et al. 2016)]
MSRKILLIGGGGHCKSVLDSLLYYDDISEIGIIDQEANLEKKVNGIPIIGSDKDIPRFLSMGYNEAFVTLGSSRQRRVFFQTISNLGFGIPVIIDKSAIISEDVKIGSGSFIGKRAIINAGASLGEGVIVNSGAIVEHDCIIGDFAHVSPGTVLCGEVEIGKDTQVGANSVVRQRVKIGSSTTVGMGSVVLKNISDNVVAYGNPCKVVR